MNEGRPYVSLSLGKERAAAVLLGDWIVLADC